MYQPGVGAYQQLMQPYVPVSCEYNASATSPVTVTTTAPEPKEKAKLAQAALNYTGVSLNKQVARGYPYQFAPSAYMPAGALPTIPSLPGMPQMSVSSYLMRPSFTTAPPFIGNPLLMASQAVVTSSVATATSTSENNNTSPQPYKKLKTT